MKRDKLYTVNKYNKPAFMREKEVNFFDGLSGSSFIERPTFESFYSGPDLSIDYNKLNSLKSPITPSLGTKLSASLGSVGLGAVGSAANRLFKKALSFGYDNKVGNAVADIGNTVGDFVNFIPGAGKLAAPIFKAATGVVGGAINGLFGEKVDKEKLAGINEDISYGRNFVSNAGSYEALTPAKALTYDTKAYKGAIFNGSAGRKNAQLKEDMDWARGFIGRSYENNIHNIADNQLEDALFYSESNQSAYGGPLDTASPTGYSFLSDILLNDKTKEENKNKMSTNNFNYFGEDSNEFASGGKIHINPKNKGKFNATKKRTGKTTEELTHSSNPLTRKRAIFAQNARKWKHADGGPLNIWCRGGKFFDLGGDIQANGTDFPTGLTHIDEGLSHELNPNGGVQVGVDSQGVPNLVEEGEVIWNDYVFSDRIGLDDTTKEVFHVNKKKDITYADLAKKLEKEVKERPNDPISKAAFSAQMDKLEEQQERQKAEMEAQRAQEAFAALSPEEQTAVMQQVAQQEQAAQDAAMQEQAAQEQAIAEQQAMQGQPTPEEAAMMQQQQIMQAEPQMGQQQVMGQPMMAAYGGNLFAGGGDTSKYKGKNVSQILEMLKAEDYYTSDEDLQKQAEDIHNTLIEEIKNSRDNKRYEQSIEWLNKKHPEFGNQLKEIVAKLIVNSASSNGITGTFNPETTFRKMVPTTNFSDNNVEKYIRKLMQDGSMPFEAALAVANTFNPKRGNNREYIQQSIKLKPKFETASSNTPATQPVGNALQENAAVPNRWNLGNTYTGFTGGTTPYNADSSNSSSNANTRDKVKESILSHYGTPDERTIVGDIIDNISDNDFAAFENLDDNGKMAYIIKAFENQNQDSGNDVPAKAESSQSVKPATQNQQSTTQRNTARSSTYRNVGKLKGDQQTAWRNFVLPGLNKFIDEWGDRINNAATQEERNGLIDQMVDAFNGIQQSYNDSVWPNIGKSGYYYDPKVESHQKDWSRNYGNTGFFVAQPDGTTIDAIGQAVDKAGSMGDNPNDGGIDGYNGPNTALRNFGATMYGDAAFYKPIIDRFRDLGVDYRLSENLKNGDDALYILSRRAAQSPAPVTEATPEGLRGVLGEASRTPGIPTTIGDKTPAATTPAGNGAPVTTGPEGEYVYKPRLDPETKLGLFGPAVAMGLMAAGVGRPNFAGLDRARAIASAPAVHATYQPIGNYLRYSPFDIWSAQNRLDAENRSTQRAMMNQSSPSRNAGLAALAYSENIGAGQAQRQAAESNLNQDVQKAGFNQSTDIHNSNAFNSVSQFNATQDNQANRFNGSMAFQDAIQRENARASWFNSLYGNINQAFKGLSDYEREVRDRNNVAKMVASGIFPGVNPDNAVYAGYVDKVPKRGANGGKIARKKNKKRGLTI